MKQLCLLGTSTRGFCRRSTMCENSKNPIMQVWCSDRVRLEGIKNSLEMVAAQLDSYSISYKRSWCFEWRTCRRCSLKLVFDALIQLLFSYFVTHPSTWIDVHECIGSFRALVRVQFMQAPNPDAQFTFSDWQSPIENQTRFDVKRYISRLECQTLGTTLVTTTSLPSTQEFLKNNTHFWPNGCVVVADRQTEGKGEVVF